MRVVWISLLVRCFEVIGASDNPLVASKTSSMTSDRDMWVNGKPLREGDPFSDCEPSEELHEAVIEQREREREREKEQEEREQEQGKNDVNVLDKQPQKQSLVVGEDLEKKQKDSPILTSSYGDRIKNSWRALVQLLWCASGGKEQSAQQRQAYYIVTAQPAVPRCYSCKQDPLCVLNCCCCCFKVIGFCTKPCQSDT